MTRSRRHRITSNISVATRLSLIALLVTLISLVVTAAVGLQRGNELADGLAEARLVSTSASRATEIEAYVRSAQRELASLAISHGTANAISEFGDGYLDLVGDGATASERAALTNYYLADVAPPLEEVRGVPVAVSTLMPTQDAALDLQHNYSIPRPSDPEDEDAPPVDPVLVDDAGDGSSYSEVHARLHPVYLDIASRSGFDDFYLIDARNDLVVYSVQKRFDFATSLAVGPLSGSAISDLVDTVGDDATPGSSGMSDLSPYAPAEDRPVAFVASPVIADGALVGYVAASLSSSVISDITTGGEDWSDYGATGETYLAGHDAIMRTEARPYVEQPTVYLAESETDSTLTEAQRRIIQATGTTALVQPVNRRVITAAEADGDGIIETTNYRGDAVRTAYRQVELDGVDWVMFAEVARTEIDRPIEEYARNMLLAVAVFVIVVTFVAVRWSSRLIAPIRQVSSRLRAVRAGREPLDSERDVPDGSPQEYLDLSSNIDDMLRRLDAREADVDERAAERAELVREFLPAAIVHRAEQGDGQVLDHVPNATVVVIVLRGLGGSDAAGRAPELRSLLARIVDQTDALAAEFGLERVKVTGDAYYAVCGVSRPYLDHAPRSVAFALAARELLDEIVDEHGGSSIATTAGLASGAVSVGLTARAGLVYDAWGPAVTQAADLARRGADGDVVAGPEVQGQLPAEFVIDEDAAVDGGSVISGRVDANGVVS